MHKIPVDDILEPQALADLSERAVFGSRQGEVKGIDQRFTPARERHCRGWLRANRCGPAYASTYFRRELNAIRTHIDTISKRDSR